MPFNPIQKTCAITFLLLLATGLAAQTTKIPGHGRPFGAHMQSMGVTMIGKFSSPAVFFGHFVKASKPIHMKSAMTEAKHPGMQWTDAFLKKQYGTELVRVEMGKKEVRSRKARWMRLKKFLEDYSHSDLYMVHSASDKLKELVEIPPTLQCGGFHKSLQEAVVWMGKGPLHSVLHYDDLDNLLCVFSGTKDVILVNQLYREKVEADGFVKEGHYSSVNMENVDMHSFPQFQDLPWHRVHLTAGDCLYIPYRWYHQVSSYGERNLAMNIWFSHLWWFDDYDCEDTGISHSMRPLNNYGFASANQAVRSHWLEAFEGADDDVDITDFLQRVSSGTEDHKQKAHHLVDINEDGLLSWEELYGFDIDKGLLLYPDVFSRDQDSSQEELINGESSFKATQLDEHEATLVKAETTEKIAQEVEVGKEREHSLHEEL